MSPTSIVPILFNGTERTDWTYWTDWTESTDLPEIADCTN